MSDREQGRCAAAMRRARRIGMVLAMAWLTGMAGAGYAGDAGILTGRNGALRTDAGGAGPGFAAVQVEPSLMRALADGHRTGFMIEFRERADFGDVASMDWQTRGRHVHAVLTRTAERSQAAVRRALEAQGASVESFWIRNVLWVHDGDLAALETASRFSQVAKIVRPPAIRQMRPVEPPVADARRGEGGVAANIAHVGADRAWARGIVGRGVTVGVIDDGALYTHEAIIGQYRGNLGGGAFEHDYHWMGMSREPEAFESAHGTHVLGTILGDDRDADPARRDRIGMAPGAEWIACNRMADFKPDLMLLACGQFMLAPTRLDGQFPNPDLRPHVINNSWSEGDCDGSASDFYRDIVEAWIAAGIFPAFAVGNTTSCGMPAPPGLSSLSSPASLGIAFAVGSTGNSDGAYAPHSLWGPTDDPSPGLPDHPDHKGHPLMKPQVVAPGVDIRSAMIEGEDSYGTMTGTSMSTPHVAGLVALMLEAGECLVGDYAAIGGIIMDTARPVPYDSGGSPPPGLGNVPNYATGWGEIDALAAVEAAAAACGPNGLLRGRVLDKAGGTIAAARVEAFVEGAGRVYETTSEADGSYVLRLPALDAGYRVRASAYGYLPAQEDGVRIYDGQTTGLDPALPLAPTHLIEGAVRDAATGWPLHARIAVVGAPVGTVWSDPASGRYAVRLPEGQVYRLDVATEIPGYVPRSIELPDVAAAAGLDIALSADSAVCAAPGYAFAGTAFSEDFEAGALPAGWQAASAGLGWLFGDAAAVSSPGFAVPAHGGIAAANDQLGAEGGEANDGRFDYLVLPPQNLAAMDRPALRYRSFHTWDEPVYPERVPAAVEASRDGGATWVRLGRPAATTFAQGWTEEVVDLSPVSGTSVLIRFHADDRGDLNFNIAGPGWAIDDVEIRVSCTPPAGGGLIVGQVRDANTGVAMNGAIVDVDGAAPALTRASEDPGLAGGFYAAFAPAHADTVRAQPGPRHPDGYGTAQTDAAPVPGGTVRRDLALPAGRLRIFPEAPAATVELGTTATTTFSVANTGTRELSFGFEGVIAEEHFDAGTMPAGWIAQTAGAPCPWHLLDPLLQPNYAGGDGPAVWVDLHACDGQGSVDSALVMPPLDLAAASTAAIGFIISLEDAGESHPRFDVEASADGGTSWSPVHTETAQNNGTGPGATVEADLTAFAGHSDVRVRFRYQAQPPWGWVMIDQVHLFASMTKGALLVEPVSGVLAPGESRDLQATFDASTVAQPGVYEVPVRIAENTPYPFAFGDMRAVMTVTPPASYGAIDGLVRGLGACDMAPSAIAGAAVTIEDGQGARFGTSSDEQGGFRYWPRAADGPFTVTVAAAGHQAASFEVELAAGQTQGLAADLRALLPCLALDPDPVEASGVPGTTVTRQVDLLNGGAGAAAWTLRAGGDPKVLTPVPIRQTTSPALEQFLTFSCIDTSTGLSMENRYLRVFPIDGAEPVQVHGLSFGVDAATSAQGSQPLSVRVYRLDGPLAWSGMTLLAEKTIALADTSLERTSVAFDQPVAVPAGATLVAELHVPDGADGGSNFYPGGNGAGESAPAYHAAPGCGYDEPVAYGDLGVDFIHLVLELDVLASDPCGAAAAPVPWLSFSPSSGQIGADAIVPLEARLDAGPAAAGVLHGSACLAAGDAGEGGWRVVPVNLHVNSAADPIFANGFE